MLAVRILTDEEFDNLPYPEAKMSLGVADTKTGTAYVRYTHSDELNKYLIEHELEHLLGEDRDEVHHGGDGVYYKGLGNIFQGIGQAAQGAGQSIFGGLQKVGEGISGAGRSVMGMFGGGQSAKPLDVGMKGAASNAGRMGPQIAMPSAGPSMQGAMSNAGRMGPQLPSSKFNPLSLLSGEPDLTLQSSVRKTASNITPIPKPMTTNIGGHSLGSNMSSSAANNIFSGFKLPNNIPTGAMSAVSKAGAPMSLLPPSSPAYNPSGMGNVGSLTSATPNVLPQTRPGTPASNPMDMFKDPTKLAVGAGLEGIGQFGIQTPNVPDLSELPSVQQLRNFNFNSVGELDPALQTAIENDFKRIEEREDQEFIARYKSLRPGADIESDSNFKRDWIALKEMQGQRKADALAKYRFQMIQQNLQISQAELAQLQDLANMDIQSIMMQMGLDYADAQKFKDTFSRIGDTLISQGLGVGEEPANA